MTLKKKKRTLKETNELETGLYKLANFTSHSINKVYKGFKNKQKINEKKELKFKEEQNKKEQKKIELKEIDQE